MCGLFGFIGESNNPQLSHELSTELFIKTQSRGIDASGFYCTEGFNSKKISYYKKPVPAVDFIKTKEYENLWKNSLNLGLFHCRAASVGVGIPAFNQNNHPFVSKDLKKAVIHNGVISRDEYEYFKQYYEVETECDSEIFLRILEQEDSFAEKAKRFFSHAKLSHYAVAFTENTEDFRRLHLFRNEHRPLVIVDLIDELNQIFFCSTVPIFFEAVDCIKSKIKKTKVYELPTSHYMCIEYHKNGNFQVEEYKVNTKEQLSVKNESNFYSIKKDYTDWQNNVLEEFNSMKEVLEFQVEKLLSQAHYVHLNYMQDSILDNNAKTAMIFNSMKDINKRLESLVRQIDS